MPRITKKGMPSWPERKTLSPVESKWLKDLQLRFPDIRTAQVSVDLGSIAATSYDTASVTMAGVTTNDGIIVNPPALTAGLYFISARVSAADTIELLFYNSTGGAIDEAAANYIFIAIAR